MESQPLQDSMPPATPPRVTLRLVPSPTPAPKEGLAALVRHPDGSVTLDGHQVLPSHAERQAQLRSR